MLTQVRRIGNSLGNTIPASVIRQLHLVEGSYIEIKTQGNKIIIEPVKNKKGRFPYTEKELLKGLDANNSHADELANISAKELGE